MIGTIVIILAYVLMIVFGLILPIIQHYKFHKEHNEYKDKQRKLRERFEKRRVVLINNNNTMEEYDDCYIWIDEHEQIWNIDYYNNFILFDKLNKPTK